MDKQNNKESYDELETSALLDMEQKIASYMKQKKLIEKVLKKLLNKLQSQYMQKQKILI